MTANRTGRVRKKAISKLLADAFIAAMTKGDPWDDPETMRRIERDEKKMRRAPKAKRRAK